VPVQTVSRTLSLFFYKIVVEKEAGRESEREQRKIQKEKAATHFLKNLKDDVTLYVPEYVEKSFFP
jgi:hypothetical protein